MRLKSAIWVSAYLRRVQVEGSSAVLRRRGAEEAGAIFIKVSKLDGNADLYGPAPQTAFGDDEPGDRLFAQVLSAVPEADVEAKLAKEIKFDPDLWLIEVEDRAGRYFLDQLAR